VVDIPDFYHFCSFLLANQLSPAFKILQTDLEQFKLLFLVYESLQLNEQTNYTPKHWVTVIAVHETQGAPFFRISLLYDLRDCFFHVGRTIFFSWRLRSLTLSLT